MGVRRSDGGLPAGFYRKRAWDVGARVCWLAARAGNRPRVTLTVVALLGLVIAAAPGAVIAGTVPAFVVNSTIDEPDAGPTRDGICASTPSNACTLRAAIACPSDAPSW